MRKIVSYREMATGGRLPTGYGVAWREINTINYVMYPVPLNVLFRWLRDLWIKCHFDYTWKDDEQKPHDWILEEREKIKLGYDAPQDRDWETRHSTEQDTLHS